MSLIKIESLSGLADMDLIGSVELLGSTVLEGKVMAYGKGTMGAPSDPVSAGYFGCTKGTFRMVYPFNEQATVVKGSVRLTDESSGVATVFAEGDSWTVAKGTPILWEVSSEEFIKHYLAAA